MGESRATRNIDSKKVESLYNAQKENLPNETPYQIMKAVKSDLLQSLRVQVDATDTTMATKKNDQPVIDSSSPLVQSSTRTSALVYALCQHNYYGGVLWCRSDVAGIKHATTFVISSFAVDQSFGTHLVSKNAGKKGC